METDPTTAASHHPAFKGEKNVVEEGEGVRKQVSKEGERS